MITQAQLKTLLTDLESDRVERATIQEPMENTVMHAVIKNQDTHPFLLFQYSTP